MHERLLEILVDPAARGRLRLTTTTQAGDEIQEGTLQAESGQSYGVVDGIPRFVPRGEQTQTADSFGYKWGRQNAYELDHYLDFIKTDEPPRWGVTTIEEFQQLFHGRTRILEGGCGSAHFASIYVPHLNADTEWVGTDLSSAIDIAKARLGARPRTQFVQANLLQLPYAEGAFDLVFCRGVMHHTPSTHAAFTSLARAVAPGGELMFMIYRRMGPIREFTDEYVRNCVSKLSPEKGWEALGPLTKFAKALADLHVEVEVPEDIPYLEIPAGRYDIQRLIYYHFLKAYWNPDLSFDTNQHNTFDWYHPPFAFHHTEDEIRRWCDEAGFEVTFVKGLETSWAVRARNNKATKATR